MYDNIIYDVYVLFYAGYKIEWFIDRKLRSLLEFNNRKSEKGSKIRHRRMNNVLLLDVYFDDKYDFKHD